MADSFIIFFVLVAILGGLIGLNYLAGWIYNLLPPDFFVEVFLLILSLTSLFGGLYLLVKIGGGVGTLGIILAIIGGLGAYFLSKELVEGFKDKINEKR